jgi:hypothetical protein
VQAPVRARTCKTTIRRSEYNYNYKHVIATCGMEIHTGIAQGLHQGWAWSEQALVGVCTSFRLKRVSCHDTPAEAPPKRATS